MASSFSYVNILRLSLLCLILFLFAGDIRPCNGRRCSKLTSKDSSKKSSNITTSCNNKNETTKKTLQRKKNGKRKKKVKLLGKKNVKSGNKDNIGGKAEKPSAADSFDLIPFALIEPGSEEVEEWDFRKHHIPDAFKIDEFFESAEDEDYEPQIIGNPIDVLFMVDRSSLRDDELEGSKCLLRKLTAHFQVAYYKKVRIALMNPRDPPRVDFSFRRYRDDYGYQRAIEMMEYESGTHVSMGKALEFARQHVLNPQYSLGARRNVPKLIVIIIASKSNDTARDQRINTLAMPHTAIVTVGYGDARYEDLRDLSGDNLTLLYRSEAENVCGMWLEVHRQVLDHLQTLYSIPLTALKEFRLELNHHHSAEIGWKRPDDLVTHYSVRYRPSKAGDLFPYKQLQINIGQEENVRLEDLDSTEYEVIVTSHGVNISSAPLRFAFDMACSRVQADVILLVDTSTLDQSTFDGLQRGFLHSFVKGFVIGQRATRVGIIFYSDVSIYAAPLSTYTDKNELLWRLNNLYYERGMRRTGSALNFAYLNGFEYARRDVFKAIVIITSGHSQDDVNRPMQRLKADGTVILEVLINETLTEPYEIRPYGDYLYSIASFAQLQTIHFNLTTAICSEAFKYYKTVYPILPPPKHVMVNEIRNTSVQINWEHPDPARITGFDITIENTGDIYSVGRRSRSLILQRLLPGHDYNLLIRSIGFGMDSRDVRVTATTDVLPPPSARAEQLNSTTAEISWESPSNDVIFFEVSIYLRSNQQMIQTVYKSNTSDSVSTSRLLPGTHYEIWVHAIYVDDVKSRPARTFITTGLPVPENFHISRIIETSVVMGWKMAKFQMHDDSRTLVYHVRVSDELGNLVGQHLIQNTSIQSYLAADNQTIGCSINNLTPGRRHNATLQIFLGTSVESNVSKVEFQTRRVRLSLDVSFVVEISPALRHSEVVGAKEFLKSLASAFDHDAPGVVKFGLIQLSNHPIEMISMQKKSDQNIIKQNLNSLFPMGGSSVLKPEEFKETVVEAFKHARSGVPRIMVLLVTNQHYTNLMPESEEDFADKGITSIVLQMALNTEAPYSNQSVMHRYVLSAFDQLHLVVNHVVIDAIRSQQYPLPLIERERDLKPHAVAVFRDTTGNNVAEWWAASEWPEHYRMRVADEAGDVWKRNVTVRRRVHYRYRFMGNLATSTPYFFILEAYSRDNKSAAITVDMETDSVGKLIGIRRSKVDANHLLNPKHVMLPNGQCCSRHKDKPLKLKARHVKHLSAASKKVGTCMHSGSNVIFLVDGSNTTSNTTFDQIKQGLKKLVKNLHLEGINKLAEAKKRQFLRRGILFKIPKVMTHGVGMSVVQYSQLQAQHLPLLTKLTTKQVTRSIDDARQLGGLPHLDQALRFLQKNALGKYSFSSRDIVVLITSSKSRQRTLKRSQDIKNTGARIITIDLNALNYDWTSQLASPPRTRYSFQLTNGSDFSSDAINNMIQTSICKAASRRLKSSKKTISKKSTDVASYSNHLKPTAKIEVDWSKLVPSSKSLSGDVVFPPDDNVGNYLSPTSTEHLSGGSKSLDRDKPADLQQVSEANRKHEKKRKELL